MSDSISGLFQADRVFLGVEAKDSEELFQQLEGLLQTKGLVKPTWHQAIAAREQDFPTGLHFKTCDIAIPHVDPEHIEQEYVAVIKPSEPVLFEPMGKMGDPVHASLVINLGIMQGGGQVKMLQALMKVFMDEASAADILSQDSAEGIVEAFERHMHA